MTNYFVDNVEHPLIGINQVPNTISFGNSNNEEICRIDADGIMRVRVDPSDENAKLFVECVNRFLGSGKELTKVEAI